VGSNLKNVCKNVFITGASTGIGLALVKELRQDPKIRIIATARESSMDRFKENGVEESERLLLKPLDICDYEKASVLIHGLDEKLGGVDVLVNNAGVSYRSVVEHMNPEAENHQMMVNYLGAVHLIREVLPSMRKKRQGRIINVSSVGGMMAMPTMASYSASKFALEGVSEALWYELKPWGIKISLIQPGFIRSDAFQRVLMPEAAKNAQANEKMPYHHYYAGMTPFVEKFMKRSPCTPEKIAKIIVKTMKKKNPRLRVPAGPDARFFSFLRRMMPRRLYHWILYKNLPNIQRWGTNR